MRELECCARNSDRPQSFLLPLNPTEEPAHPACGFPLPVQHALMAVAVNKTMSSAPPTSCKGRATLPLCRRHSCRRAPLSVPPWRANVPALMHPREPFISAWVHKAQPAPQPQHSGCLALTADALQKCRHEHGPSRPQNQFVLNKQSSPLRGLT